jgi:hypothetical protein
MDDSSSSDFMAAIRSLDEATALGFANNDARFAAMDTKIEREIGALRHEMNRRFDAADVRIDRRFDEMEQRFGAMDQRFDAMDQRFDAMDQRQTGTA